MVQIHLYDILEEAKLQGQKKLMSGFQGLGLGAWVNYKLHWRILGGDGTVLYLNWGDGYMTAYICRNSYNYIFTV